MAKKPTPRCQACCRIETAKGWSAAPERPGAVAEVYETLCQDCLATWTTDLLSELEAIHKDRAA